MSWPIPGPGDIAERFAVGFEQAFANDLDGAPYPESPDTRSANSPFRVIGVVSEEVINELYLYQRSLADELMPDRAQDNLSRHAAEWGVGRLLPLTSLGSLIFAGAPTTVLPAGIEVYGPTGLRWSTSAAAVIGSSRAVSVPAEAEAPGTASDIAAGTRLPLVSPVAGLDAQSATVDAQGFQGGRDIEPVEAWRARILRRIRERGRAGKAADYEDWATEAGAAYVRVIPSWVGAGSVAVVVAMAGPRAPTDAELARITAHIDAERPVTAVVVVLAATLSATAVQLALSPDAVTTRAAASIALAAYFQRDGRIGLPLPKSRLDEALSSATGEYAHVVAVPAGDVVPGPTQLPVLGAVTFTDGSALPQDPG